MPRRFRYLRCGAPLSWEHGREQAHHLQVSEAARELGISIEWIKAGEKRGFFPPALRDRKGHRYFTEDIERMRKG